MKTQDGTIAKGAKIVIGGYDLQKFAKPNEKVNWMPISGSGMFWSVSLGGVGI